MSLKYGSKPLLTSGILCEFKVKLIKGLAKSLANECMHKALTHTIMKISNVATVVTWYFQFVHGKSNVVQVHS